MGFHLLLPFFLFDRGKAMESFRFCGASNCYFAHVCFILHRHQMEPKLKRHRLNDKNYVVPSGNLFTMFSVILSAKLRNSLPT